MFSFFMYFEKVLFAWVGKPVILILVQLGVWRNEAVFGGGRKEREYTDE